MAAAYAIAGAQKAAVRRRCARPVAGAYCFRANQCGRPKAIAAALIHVLRPPGRTFFFGFRKSQRHISLYCGRKIHQAFGCQRIAPRFGQRNIAEGIFFDEAGIAQNASHDADFGRIHVAEQAERRNVRQRRLAGRSRQNRRDLPGCYG